MLKSWLPLKKRVFLSFDQPTNLRELTRAQVNDAWLKVRELSHTAWLNSCSGILRSLVERKWFLFGKE